MVRLINVPKHIPFVSTTWLQLTLEQVHIFQRTIKELPELFIQEETMKLFERYNLKQCFSFPPSNYKLANNM